MDEILDIWKWLLVIAAIVGIVMSLFYVLRNERKTFPPALASYTITMTLISVIVSIVAAMVE